MLKIKITKQENETFYKQIIDFMRDFALMGGLADLFNVNTDGWTDLELEQKLEKLNYSVCAVNKDNSEYDEYKYFNYILFADGEFIDYINLGALE